MQEPDLELQTWRHQWQSQETIPADLAKKVEAGTRSMRRGLMGEILVTLVMGGGSLAWALSSPKPEVTVFAIAVWILITVAWVFSLLLRRGAWQPVTTTTAAFLEVSILRCERSLQAVTIQAVLYVVILTFDLVWLYYYRNETSVRAFLSRPIVLAFLFFITPTAAAGAAWYRHRVRRELRNLIALRRSSG
jgi:hypothetical protein